MRVLFSDANFQQEFSSLRQQSSLPSRTMASDHRTVLVPPKRAKTDYPVRLSLQFHTVPGLPG